MEGNLNYFHFLTLAHLLSLGAKETHTEITSSQISKVIQRSQQTASKILIELEKDSLIERIKNNRKFKIKVTQEGFEVIKELHGVMKTAIDSSRSKRVIFKGKIVTGMGEGSYYMSKKGYKDQFREKLGYEPYPGTLNIKLEEQIYKDTKREITGYPSIYIHGFKDENRTFGWVKCYPTILIPGAKETDKVLENSKKNYENMEIESAILLLERTHHNNSLVEVISPVCIKETASLKNGDIVTIELKDLD
jgi:riboflavin kinase, archaea type